MHLMVKKTGIDVETTKILYYLLSLPNIYFPEILASSYEPGFSPATQPILADNWLEQQSVHPSSTPIALPLNFPIFEGVDSTPC